MAIGTTAALLGGSLLSAGLQSKAAGDATKAQTKGANNATAEQRRQYDTTRNDLAVYRQGGDAAQRAYDYELGLGERPMIGQQRPQITAGANGKGFTVNGQTFNTMLEAENYANANATGGTAYGGYTKTPGYDYRMQSGMDALQSSAAARGGLYSGAAMRDSIKYGQDYGTNEYGNYLARLGGRADTGAQAATNTGNFGAQAASNIGNIQMAKGNALAAGSIAQGNAWNGAIQNGLGIWNYQRSLAQSA